MTARRVFDEAKFTDAGLIAVIDDLPLWSAAFGLALLGAVRLRRGITAVDLGSGTGFPVVELAERLGRSSQVHAVDPWMPGLERMRAKIDGREVPNIVVHAATAEHLPFADRSVDLIVSNNGLNNVADLDRALRECARVARPGAQLVFTWNLPETMHEAYGVVTDVLAQALGDAAEASRRVREHIFAKRKPLSFMRQRVDAAGFIVDRVIEDAFELRFIDGTAMFDHFLMRTGFIPAWLPLVEAPLLDGVLDGIEARLNALAATQGDLRLSVPFACMDCTRG